jgi:HSP20 family protein
MSIPLAGGATADGITATYRDGILEVRVPVAVPPSPGKPRKIPISHG